MGEVGDRPPFVSRYDIEEFRNAGGEAVDPQLRVEEQDSNVRRRHEILNIAVGARDVFQLGFKLAVDGLQLLIDRLQLLLAGLQLFGCRSVFLVDGLQFFVGRPQLFVRSFIFLSRGSELRLAELQFLQKLLNLRVGRLFLDFRGSQRRLAERVAFEEEDDGGAIGVGFGIEGPRLQINPTRRAIEAHGDRSAKARFIACENPMKRSADIKPQFLARQFRDVVRQRAAGRLQIAPGLLGQMHHPVGLIDDQARRREPFERLAMNSRLDRRAKSGRRPNRERLKPNVPEPVRGMTRASAGVACADKFALRGR